MVTACVCLVAPGCGGSDEEEPAPAGSEEEAEALAEPELGSISIDDLEECKGQPGRPDYVCGSIEVPFEREDPSYGTTEIGFAVLPASGESEGAIFAVEGGPGYPFDRHRAVLPKPLRRPARDPRPRPRRPARSGDLRACGLPRPPARVRSGRAGACELRGAPGQALHLVSDVGRGGRHRLGAPSARLRGDRALRRLVRHLPRPVLRLPPRRQARGARPRLGLSDLRRERVVPEPAQDRRRDDPGGVRPLAPLRGRRAGAPCAGRRGPAPP